MARTPGRPHPACWPPTGCLPAGGGGAADQARGHQRGRCGGPHGKPGLRSHHGILPPPATPDRDEHARPLVRPAGPIPAWPGQVPRYPAIRTGGPHASSQPGQPRPEGFRAASRPIYSHAQTGHIQGDDNDRAAGALVPAGQLHVNCTQGRWSPCPASATGRTTPLISLLAEVRHQLSLTAAPARGRHEHAAARWQAQLQWIGQHQQQPWAWPSARQSAQPLPVSLRIPRYSHPLPTAAGGRWHPHDLGDPRLGRHELSRYRPMCVFVIEVN
jgi:hypothetical protein